MTDGEKMVWAAAFAASSVHGTSTMSCVSAADNAVVKLRSAALKRDPTAEEISASGAEPSDVEAALVETLRELYEEFNDDDYSDRRGVISRVRLMVQGRISRPLRGAK